MNSLWFYAVIAAISFAYWPLVAKPGGVSPGWLGILISLGTATISIGVAWTETPPSNRGVFFGLLAGVFAGAGMLAYAKVLGWP